jgi:hypothetical protein
MTPRPIEKVLAAITSKTGRAPVGGTGQWKSLCPAHDDTNPSLSIAETPDGTALVHCYAGCSQDAIVAAMGLRKEELFPPKADAPPKPDLKRHEKEAYDYLDEGGNLLFQVVRFEPKDFRQRRPDPEKPGKWVWSIKGVRRVLYRLPDIIKAMLHSDIIFMGEGEKDVMSLVSLGLCATCNSGGAGKWLSSYTDTLSGADVILIADKDGPGRNHAAIVLKALTGRAKSVKVIELPDRAGFAVKDAADWVAAGGTSAELMELVQSAPLWVPPLDVAPAITVAPPVRPYRVEPQATRPVAAVPAAVPVGIGEIRARLWEINQIPRISLSERNRMIADAVLQWLHGRGQFYHHLELRDFGNVMFFDNERKVLLSIQSDGFLAWLSDCLAINRADRVFAFVQAAVETEGLSERSAGILPSSFWASRGGVIYMSCGPGRVVRISAQRVETVDNGSDGILFPYGATLAPWSLVTPVDPFEACSLFRDMSTTAPHGRDLFRLWVISLPSDQRTKPPAVFSGVVGSGKTRVVAGIFELFGIPKKINKVDDKGEGDFWTVVNAGGLTCLDNADIKIDWLPDTLAAASTGGSKEKRKLYTDSVNVTLTARAWIAVTSSNPLFAADPGLADRLVLVRLDRRKGETAETTLSDEIAQHRDSGLSYIAHTLSRALADKEVVPGGLNSRHPDFANMAVRIGRAIGRGEEAIAALRAAEADKGMFNLENDNVGAALLELLRAGPFCGTAVELVTALATVNPAFEGKLSSRGLSRRLGNLWPHLESVFGAEQERNSHTKLTSYHFHPTGSADSADCKTGFPGNPLRESNINTFAKTAFGNTQTPQTNDLPPGGAGYKTENSEKSLGSAPGGSLPQTPSDTPQPQISLPSVDTAQEPTLDWDAEKAQEPAA